MNIKYHFLTASTNYYSENNFNDLLNEENKYKGYVFWRINGNYGIHKISKGDKCLIYYSNLPDGSSRILFYGDVESSDYDIIDNKSICDDAKPGEKYIKLELRIVSLEDNKKFSLESLRKKYKLVSDQGRFSYLHIYNDKHQHFIDDIEAAVKYKKRGNVLKIVNDYFNNNYCMCEFGCRTFIEESGFYYIEKHHLIEKNIININQNIDNIDKIINNDNNLFKLCPSCHMKIHHAKIEVRKEMIKKLYLKNKEYFDNNFNGIKNKENTVKNKNNTLEWIYQIYKCYR